MKIVLINHTFQDEQFCKRWKLLAEQHPDWDVTLLAPSEWTWGSGNAVTFGKVEKKTAYEFDTLNYHVHPVKIKEHKFLGWTSDEMIEAIKRIHPDCIYHIGSHTQESLMQILKYKKKCDRNVKVFAFSMRGPQQNIDNIKNLRQLDVSHMKKALRIFQFHYEKHKVRVLNELCDAIFCHYPDGKQCFIDEGYKGPIFMQTQVGVDIDVFFPDDKKRKSIRDKYKIEENTFVFASAVRFNPSKGVLKVLKALPQEGDWKYLLMGSGLPHEIEAIEKLVAERHLENKVIMPGFISWDNMADHWNAADCAIHFTQTTPTWIETFSLALVQAMATGLPVIGSDSGSVPYQIGPDGIIVNENDVERLNEKIVWTINNRKATRDIGIKLFNRTVQSFSTKHLNEMFYHTVNALFDGDNCADYEDMTAEYNKGNQ